MMYSALRSDIAVGRQKIIYHTPSAQAYDSHCLNVQAVERAAASLMSRFNTDINDPRVGLVRLTGLAHADERAAFREMARQLCG